MKIESGLGGDLFEDDRAGGRRGGICRVISGRLVSAVSSTREGGEWNEHSEIANRAHGFLGSRVPAGVARRREIHLGEVGSAKYSGEEADRPGEPWIRSDPSLRSGCTCLVPLDLVTPGESNQETISWVMAAIDPVQSRLEAMASRWDERRVLIGSVVESSSRRARLGRGLDEEQAEVS